MKSSGRTHSYYLAPLTIVFVLLANFIFEGNGSAPKAEPLPVNNKGFAAAAQSVDTRTLPGDSVPSGPNKKQPGLSPAKASGKPQGQAAPDSSRKKEPASGINFMHKKHEPLLLVITAEEAAAAANQPDKLAAIAEVARTKGRPVVFSNNLNPAAIESIEVFKDTAAGSFGEKGKNGVMVITLKKGLDLGSFIRKPAPQKGPSNEQPAQKNNIIIRGQNMKTAEKPYILVLEKPVAGLYEQVLSQETIRDILDSGKPIADLNELDPQDIASVNALKGTSAQAFGDKGKNGLILVTLKTAVPANSGTSQETSGDWMIYPNPSENIFKINIDLPGIEEIQISAYDAQNRLVETIAKGSFWKGGHEFEWDASHLKPGYYIISLTKGKSTWRKRVIIK